MEKERWRVIYHPSTNELIRIAVLPYKTVYSVRPDPIFFKDQISIPSPSAIENILNLSESYSFIIDSLKLNDKEIENYKNLYKQYQGDQLFGYPSYEHGNLQLECELHYNNSPQIWYSSDNHFLVNAKSWTLLFEIHNMHYSNWDFGGGAVYTFWIREKDLQKNNFDDVWAHIQIKKY